MKFFTLLLGLILPCLLISQELEVEQFFEIPPFGFESSGQNSMCSEFAPIGAVWSIQTREPFEPNYEGTLNYTSIKDTLFQSERCRVLYKPYGTIFHPISGEIIIKQSGDSIFHFVPAADSFNLVIVFNANVGDSWTSFDRADEYTYFGTRHKYETRVDSISYWNYSAADSLRVQHVSTFVDYSWDGLDTFQLYKTERIIEKIGYENALFPSTDGDGLTDDIYEDQVRCYEALGCDEIKLTEGPCYIQSSSFPYATLGTEWYYEGHSLECDGNYQLFKVENKIEVQGRNCSVISSYWRNQSMPDFVKMPDSLIVWENDNMVYFFQDSSFYLMYNFDGSQQVGDTMSLYHPVDKPFFSFDFGEDEPLPHSHVITDISSISLNNTTRKVFHTEPLEIDCIIRMDSIIVGVGSMSQGIAGDACFYVADGCFGGLRCYSRIGPGMVSFTGGECFSTSVDDIYQELAAQINLFPNPSSELIQIDNSSEETITSYTIYDMAGNTMLENRFDKVQIDIAGLDQGLYLLELYSQNGRIIKRFVKH